MCRLLRLLLIRFPGRTFVFSGDSGYGTHEVARFCSRHRGRLTLVSKLHPDANLYDPPAPRRGGVGRPAVRGPRVPKPRQAVAAAAAFTAVEVGWYGGGTRRVGVLDGRGHWYKAGYGLVPVRWVFVPPSTLGGWVAAAADAGERLADEPLALIRRVYVVERALPALGSSPDAEAVRHARRQADAVPVLADLRGWLDRHHAPALPKSPLGQAVAYARANWSALARYTDRGFLTIDNNRSERALRQVAVGRNNWGWRAARPAAGPRWSCTRSSAPAGSSGPTRSPTSGTPSRPCSSWASNRRTPTSPPGSPTRGSPAGRHPPRPSPADATTAEPSQPASKPADQPFNSGT